MEGKEVRFGIANSALFATVTTDASCGAVNSMHDSFTPLGGMVPLANIMLSEVIFGGVGAGMYGILIYIVLAVFIAGLMVGRTPEYLGKKIESYDVKMAMLVVLVFPLTILIFAAISVVSPTFGTSQLNNAGPHGLSEILYAFTSGDGKQRFSFRGHFGKYALVQLDDWHGHVGRAVLHDHSDAGNCRQPGTQEDRASITGHVSSNDAPFYDAAHQCDRHCRRVDFLSGAQLRPDCRAPADASRETDVLKPKPEQLRQ